MKEKPMGRLPHIGYTKPLHQILVNTLKYTEAYSLDPLSRQYLIKINPLEVKVEVYQVLNSLLDLTLYFNFSDLNLLSTDILSLCVEIPNLYPKQLPSLTRKSNLYMLELLTTPLAERVETGLILCKKNALDLTLAYRPTIKLLQYLIL
jgi:hypothetical protein